MKFKWQPRVSSSEDCDEDTQVLVCPEFNKFDPIYMGTLNSNGEFELPLMTP